MKKKIKKIKLSAWAIVDLKDWRPFNIVKVPAFDMRTETVLQPSGIFSNEEWAKKALSLPSKEAAKSKRIIPIEITYPSNLLR